MEEKKKQAEGHEKNEVKEKKRQEIDRMEESEER